MILNGQHSVNCFRYGPIGMHFKINLVPDPSCKASRLDIFVDKSTQMVIFSPFLQCFGQRTTMKLHYKAPQWQLSQGCTILLIYIVLFVRIMCDYAEICKLCNQIEIFDQLCEIAPSHFIRGPV